ncbi:hypothetical protein AB0G79_03750 [Streptomyces sp. NPDC020807]|uniref:hypothetical protein n=1 Tax=Streptomyces sp. NPDC020807 TaxID=3155119 RepID=UPI0033C039FA
MEYTEELARLLIDQELTRVEARHDSYYAVATGLSSYADLIEGNAGEANLAVQRLLSTGSGEAMNALATHWSKVLGHDAQSMTQAARLGAKAANRIGYAIEAAKVQNLEIAVVCAAECEAAVAGSVITFGASLSIVEPALALARGRSQSAVDGCHRQIFSDLASLRSDPSVAALPTIVTDLASGVGGGTGSGGGQDTGRAWGGSATDPGRAWGGSLPAPGTGGTTLRVDHAEHERAAGRLREVAVEVWGTTAGTIQGCQGDHNNAANSGALGAAVAGLLGPVLEDLSRATTEFGAHLDGALANAIEQISLDQQSMDDGLKQKMSELDR